jgi:hypothetical protein
MKSFATLLILILMSMEVLSQNPGEIIFSKKMAESDKVSMPVKLFKAGDAIYSVAYLSKTVQELFNAKPESKVQVEVYIYKVVPPLYNYQQPSEEQLVFANMWVSGKALKNKYLVIDIVPEPDKTTAYGSTEITYKEFGKKFEGPVAFAESIATLQPGKHSLNFVVNCNYEPVAKGSIEIEGSDYSIYAQKAVAINQAAASAGSKNAMFPKALMTNATTESQMIAALKGSNDWKTGFINGTEVLKIAIADADWYIRRHEITGAILHRYIRAAVAYRTKDNRCAFRLITFQEDYVGEKFQPMKYDGAGDQVIMECKNL